MHDFGGRIFKLLKENVLPPQPFCSETVEQRIENRAHILFGWVGDAPIQIIGGGGSITLSPASGAYDMGLRSVNLLKESRGVPRIFAGGGGGAARFAK